MENIIDGERLEFEATWIVVEPYQLLTTANDCRIYMQPLTTVDNCKLYVDC